MQGQLDAHLLTRALEPWSTGRSYLNFAENEVDARTGYDDGRGCSSRGSGRPTTPTTGSSPTTASRGSSRTAASPTDGASGHPGVPHVTPVDPGRPR